MCSAFNVILCFMLGWHAGACGAPQPTANCCQSRKTEHVPAPKAAEVKANATAAAFITKSQAAATAGMV